MWAGVIFQDWEQNKYTGKWSDPVLGIVRKRQSEEGSRFYYGGGATYCRLVAPGVDYQIVKVYSGNEEDVYLQFHRDNPPIATAIDIAIRTRYNIARGKNEPHLEGWLSPGGVYYECAYGSHNTYADKLVAFYYGELEGYGYSLLMDMRWIAIHESGYIEPYDGLLTPGQAKTLTAMIEGMKNQGLKPPMELQRQLYLNAPVQNPCT